MKQRLKEIYKKLSNPKQEQNIDNIEEFTNVFQQWLDSLTKNESGFLDKISTKSLIFESLKLLTDLVTKDVKSVIPCTGNILEILKLLDLPLNDPDIRHEGWNSTIIIASYMSEYIEFNAWELAVKTAFNLMEEEIRLNIGSKGNYTGETAVQQIRDIMKHTTPEKQISFYYWVQIILEFVFPSCFRYFPDKKYAYSCVFYFMQHIIHILDYNDVPIPLDPIPSFRVTAITSVYDSTVALHFIMGFNFLIRNCESNQGLHTVLLMIQKFLDHTFKYKGVPTTNDKHILDNINFSLLHSMFMPSQQASIIINTLSSSAVKVTCELLNCFIYLMDPLLELSLQTPDKLPIFLSHLIRTKLFVSNWSLETTTDDLIIYFSNTALENASPKLIPHLCNMILVLLIERCSTDINAMDSIFNDILAAKEKMDNPKPLLAVLCHIASQIAILFLHTLTGLQLEKDPNDNVPNPVLYDITKVNNELRDKYDDCFFYHQDSSPNGKNNTNSSGGGANTPYNPIFYFYIHEPTASSEICKQFIMNLFSTFSKVEGFSIIISIFAKTLLFILQNNKEKEYDPSFLESDLLDLLLNVNQDELNEVFPLINDIIVNSTHVIKTKYVFKFVSILNKVITSQDRSIQYKAIECAIKYVISGQQYCLNLIPKLLKIITTIDPQILSQISSLHNFFLTVLSVTSTSINPEDPNHNQQYIDMRETVYSLLKQLKIPEDIMTCHLHVHSILHPGELSQSFMDLCNNYIATYRITSASTFTLFKNSAELFNDIDRIYPDFFKFLIYSAVNIVNEGNLKTHQLKALSSFISSVMNNSLQENIFNSCAQFFNDCYQYEDVSSVISNDYNMFIANYNKSITNTQNIDNMEQVYLRKDETETQIITSKTELFGSNIFGSFTYHFKDGPLPLFMDSANNPKKCPFIQGKYEPEYSGIVKGLATRSQRSFIHVYADGQENPIFDSFFRIFSKKCKTKDLGKNLTTDTCYYRRERTYEMVFDDDIDKCNYAVIIGKKTVKKKLCINVYPVGNGFIGINFTGSMSLSPLKGRIVTRKEIAAKIIISSILNIDTIVRYNKSSFFASSWFVLTKEIDSDAFV